MKINKTKLAILTLTSFLLIGNLLAQDSTVVSANSEAAKGFGSKCGCRII